MGKKIRLAIVGSRSFTDYNFLVEEIRKGFGKYKIECVVSGGATGADTLGARFANENGIPLVEYKPEWDKYGKKAGSMRNVDIINNCTHCIAFWDGKSHGTKFDIKLCKEMGKPCKVVLFGK